MTVSQPQVQQFLARALYDLAAAQSATMVVIGDRLGLYRIMSGAGPLTSKELAKRSGTAERYVREWLMNQAAGGYVELRDDGSYILPEAHAAVLAADDPPVSVIAAYEAMLALTDSLDEVIGAFRSGGGVDRHRYSGDFYRALGRFSSIIYRRRLDGWISTAGVESLLRAGIRVVDVGCGTGAAIQLLARRFPASNFVGVDIHRPSIEQVRREAGGLGNVRFEIGDAGALEGSFDMAICFNMLHDMADPAAFVRAVGDRIAPQGTWLVSEPRLTDSVREMLDPLGRFASALSLLHCIPVARFAGGDGIGSVVGKRLIIDALRSGGFERIDEIDDPYCLVLHARRGLPSRTPSN